jgi:hypothetical protein
MTDIKDTPPDAPQQGNGAEQLPQNEREVNDVASGSIIALDRSMSKAQLKAVMVDILDRGVTASRLDLDVQPDIHYEWIPNNAVEKNRMRTMGFEVLSRSKHLISGNPLHEGGGDEIIVGDVIAMGCSKVRKEALDEIKSERFIAMHGKPGSRVQGEETEFTEKMRANMPDSIQPIVESSTGSLTGDALINALKPSK